MFDGNGNWTSDFSAQADRDNGIKILASRFDNIFIADIKESFENCLTKDGQIAPIGNFNMGGQKITNLNNGVNDNDAVNMSQFNNAVHKTGDETINGIKTFNNAIKLPNFTWNFVGDDAYIGDTNQAGAVCIKGNNGPTKLLLVNRAENAILGFYIDEGDNNALKLTSPTYSADRWGSVTAMISQNLGENGYVKYNNGIIIQWGRNSTTDGYVTFPTPFSNACTAVIPTRISSGDALSNIFENATTTRFKVKINGGYSSSAYFYWIAVGY